MALGTFLIVGGVALGLAAFAGGGSSVNPYGPVPLPGSPQLPWAEIDGRICEIYDGGVKGGDAIMPELWRRTYPGRPYPPRQGTAHLTQIAALASMSARLSTILQRVPVCGDAPIGEPDDGEDDEPTDTPDTPEGRAELINSWTTGKENGFSQIAGGQTLTTIVRTAYNLPASPVQRVRAALRCQVLSVYNLVFFGLPESGNDYGHAQYNGRWYSLRLAVLPRNEDVIARVLAGEKVRRTAGWVNGTATDAGHRLARVWNKTVARSGQTLSCNDDIFAPENNPPAEVLAAMGWTLDELREAFLASPLAQ